MNRLAGSLRSNLLRQFADDVIVASNLAGLTELVAGDYRGRHSDVTHERPMSEPALLAQEMAGKGDGAGTTKHGQRREIRKMGFDVAENSAANTRTNHVLESTALGTAATDPALSPVSNRSGARGTNSDDGGSRFRWLHDDGSGPGRGLLFLRHSGMMAAKPTFCQCRRPKCQSTAARFFEGVGVKILLDRGRLIDSYLGAEPIRYQRKGWLGAAFVLGKNAQSISPLNHVQRALSIRFCGFSLPCHRTAPQCNSHLMGATWP